MRRPPSLKAQWAPLQMGLFLWALTGPIRGGVVTAADLAPPAAPRPAFADIIESSPPGPPVPVASDEVARRSGRGGIQPAAAPDATFDRAVEPIPTPRVHLPFGEVVRESIFGAASEENWRPLSLRTFFTEGWDEPYYKAPEGTNGARPQYWLGAPSAVFGRDVAFTTFYVNHLNNVPGLFLTPNAPFLPVHPGTNGNEYAAYTTAELPLNQRMMLYVGNWGDSEVQLKLRLINQRNLSLLGFIGDRIPTGKAVNGDGINYVNEGFEFWWNFAPRWVIRGSSFINILTGRTSSTTVYINQVGIGRYLTSDNARHFRQLVVHCMFSSLSDISGGRGHVEDLYAFPGFRFELDRDQKWYVLGGVEVPLSGPKPFDWVPQLSVYRYF